MTTLRKAALGLMGLSLSSCNATHPEPRLIYFPESNSFPLTALYDTEKVYDEIKPFTHDIGMNGAKVLDQGAYGTCVTFAVTAALNAIFELEDGLSQQGSLELDLALGRNWWDGAYIPNDILAPLQQFGVALKKDYPRPYPRAYYRTSVVDYQKYTDKEVSEKVKDVEIDYCKCKNLDKVRQAIDKGHRVLIGFIVDSSVSGAVLGYDITVDGKKRRGGLWACQQSNTLNRCVKNNAGHEVVIVGYDDDQQLLKIRNSWGTSYGEDGHYYMTYKYFNMMVMDMTEIW